MGNAHPAPESRLITDGKLEMAMGVPVDDIV